MDSSSSRRPSLGVPSSQRRPATSDGERAAFDRLETHLVRKLEDPTQAEMMTSLKLSVPGFSAPAPDAYEDAIEPKLLPHEHNTYVVEQPKLIGQRVPKYKRPKGPRPPSNELRPDTVGRGRVIRTLGPIETVKLKVPNTFKNLKCEKERRKKMASTLGDSMTSTTKVAEGLIASIATQDVSTGKSQLPPIPGSSPVLTFDELTPSERIGTFYTPSSVGLVTTRYGRSRVQGSLTIAARDDVDQAPDSSSDEESDVDDDESTMDTARGSKSDLTESKRAMLRQRYSIGTNGERRQPQNSDSEDDNDVSNESDSPLESSYSSSNATQLLPTDPGGFLPLELFDSDEWETRSDPSRWLYPNDEGDEPSTVLGRSRYHSMNGWQWRRCKVLSYDAGKRLFAIQWVDDEGTASADHEDDSSDNAVKYVKRLNIIFDEDDEDTFLARLEDANNRRRVAERRLRYYLFITRQQDDGLARLNREWMKGIIDRLDPCLTEEPWVKKVEELVHEVASSWLLGQKRSRHDYQCQDVVYRKKLRTLDLAPPMPKKKAPQYGKFSIERDLQGSFSQAHSDVSYGLLANDKRVQNVFTWLRKEWTVRATPLSLFFDMSRETDESVHSLARRSQPKAANNAAQSGELSTGKDPLSATTLAATTDNARREPMDIKEFVRLEQEKIQAVVRLVRDAWLENVAWYIRNECDDLFYQYHYGSLLGPGAVGAKKHHAGGHNRPRATAMDKGLLRRFLRTVNLTIASQFRSFVFTSLHSFVAFFRKFIPKELMESASDAQSILSSIQSSSGGAHQSTRSLFSLLSAASTGRRVLLPLAPSVAAFSLCLSVHDQDGQITFSPSLDSIRDEVLRLYDTVASSLNEIPCLFNEYINPANPTATSAVLPEVQTMAVIRDSEPAVEALRNELEHILNHNFRKPTLLREQYRSYAYLVEKSIEDQIADVRATGLTSAGGSAALAEEAAPRPSESDAVQEGMEEPGTGLEQIDHAALLELWESDVVRFQQAGAKIQGASLNHERFNLIEVDCTELKEQLRQRCNTIAMGILEKCIASNMRQHLEHVCIECERIYDRLLQEPQSPEELQELKKYYELCESELDVISNAIEGGHLYTSTLEKFYYVLQDEDFDLCWKTYAWPSKVRTVLNEAESMLGSESKKMIRELHVDQQVLAEQLEQYEKEINELASFGDIEEVDSVYEKVLYLQGQLDHANELSKLYASRAEMFSQPVVEYPQLTSMSKTFEQFHKLWTVASSFMRCYPEWMDGQFIALDPASIDNNVSEWGRQLFKLMKHFSSDPEPVKVAEYIREKLEEFKKHIPLVHALRNPGLRDRHWTQISEIVGVTIKPSEDLTLSGLLRQDLDSKMEAISEISEVATKEYSLEKALDKMNNEWRVVKFEFTEYRDTGTYILRAIDDIQTLLDDHIVKTQTMRGSPFIKPFEERCRRWESRLLQVQEILDEWLKLQNVWLYLEPIFSSQDIMRQMPTEGRRFGSVDAMWRKNMSLLSKQPNVMVFTGTENLLENLKEANQMMEAVQKGLNQYLESKRLDFPRFFFLSNDELLEILSETRDPQRVQPHLRKCFENIFTLEFNEKGTIVSMCSGEGEVVPFIRGVNPEKLGNLVEKWLGAVESVMCDSIRSQIADAIEDYVVKPREEWVLAWPGQVVLAVSQIFWTTMVTEALERDGLMGIRTFEAQLDNQLTELVKLIRGNLTKLNRLTLGALTVLDVHARDVVSEMVRGQVNGVADFQWQAQMRYYWEEGDVMIRQVNAALKYGYEYLGNTSRLVITPLTDRAYRTLMSALQLKLGGAPAGPAGTGKTETCKDLAKAVAKQCVVFNCSDGLDYLAMGKFFKGLASAGAWACFDEFNRIDIEVLSVVAQQILTIQRGIIANMETIIFEGTEIRLRADCAIFITMNPGYAGRSELPDNLKALFRPVAMMVPNYALISEIVLFSCGFLDGRNMARKIVATYRLCSEQLSSQDHYDYGMRAVKAVLTACGQLKRKFPEQQEDELVLRALLDVNAPKFLSHDIPLFKGIISDLFPNVSLSEIDRAVLMEAVHVACDHYKLQPIPSFLDKIIQLYDMINVRHGLMLVGRPFAGKSSAYKVLAHALTQIAKNGDGGENCERKVRTAVLNPKSITLGQLYGQFDDVSHEWTDGILCDIFRKFASDPSDERKWIIFDGPVDAIWIESMNTVLDDNKKLCLVSGEIIQMSSSMNLIFEPRDLAAASPATVSRCGMVYMEPEQVGWRPLVDTYLQYDLSKGISGSERLREVVRGLFEYFVPSLLQFHAKYCVPHDIVQTSPQLLVQNLIRLFDAGLDAYRVAETDSLEGDAGLVNCMQGHFIFSLVWSFGGTVNDTGRAEIDRAVRALVSVADVAESDSKWEIPESNCIPLTETDEWKPPTTIPQRLENAIPDDGSVYDFMWDLSDAKWDRWADRIKYDPIPSDAEYTSILVPTVDSTRYSHILKLLVTHGHPVLFVGPTGTGKTVYIKQTLSNGLPGDQYRTAFLTFSARTSANKTQDVIDAKLEKRRKGIYGPPIGKKMIMFVDDMNMPQVEEYGAQPPIELLRQLLGDHGYYDCKDRYFRNIVDVQLIGAMAPPGGGRNEVSERLLRFFNVLSITEFSHSGLTEIFEHITEWMVGSFSDDIKNLTSALVQATISVYETVRKELLPVPTRPHYTFNLRDLSKVFQGISSADRRSVSAPNQFLSLWHHECTRVFGDRLVSDSDRHWFGNLLQDQLYEKFPGAGLNESHIQAFSKAFYGDFMDNSEPVETRTYKEVPNVEAAQSVVTEYLADYNAVSDKPMNLVIFPFAVDHVARIARIIRQPYGNALLIGYGGSGRQSLTRLAASICEMDVIEVEVTKTYTFNDWRADLGTMLKRAGCESKQTVFLCTDAQLQDDVFVEDINNILNTGEVPNLYPSDEVSGIVEQMRPHARAAGLPQTRNDLFALFVDRCRQNLHVVLCMSPVGDTLRVRLRQFPSLVNCCTIDWFTAWPEDALLSVGESFLQDLSEDYGETVRDAVVSQSVAFHKSMYTLSNMMYNHDKRRVYVTPTSYLELITSYRELLKLRREEVHTLRTKYENGLQKLRDTEDQVQRMQEELQALKPQLIRTTEEVEALMRNITKEKKEADGKRELIAADEEAANKKAEEARSIKEECEADLAKALPALQSAERALMTLDKKDISEVKSMKTPPAGVRLVMEAICVLKDIRPKRVDDGLGNRTNDYWEPAKKMLSNPGFLTSLIEFDKENMKESQIQLIQPYIDNPEFQPEQVGKASVACKGLCAWVRAMHSFFYVNRVVKPKKEKLQTAEREFKEVNAVLKQKQAELQAVIDKLDELERTYQTNVQKKEELEQNVEDCTQKLERAHRLLTDLGGEKIRWTEREATLSEQYHSLVGDILLASGIITYLGPFPNRYRGQAVKKWVKECQHRKIPLSGAAADESAEFSLIDTLGNPVTIRQWQIAGLPADGFSTENGIILKRSRRWSLCIDPQGQANKWIKNMEKDNQLTVLKLSDDGLVRSLQNAVQFGHPVLVENVGEHIDSTLDSLLLKQTFKSGGVLCVKVGDQIVEYSPEFRLYLTTKLSNPHYTPEQAAKVTLVNFMITPGGLEDQLLALTVQTERPELAEEKNKLVVQSAENRRQLQEIEDKILELLSVTEGNILDDESVINVLGESKKTSDTIAAQQEESDKTEAGIDATRRGYQPCAHRGAVLFFTIAQLAAIDPMYQYSLSWYTHLFRRALETSPPSDDLETRLESVIKTFTYNLYVNVCRSLFEKHKLLFSLMTTLTLTQDAGSIHPSDVEFLVTGRVLGSNTTPSESRLGAQLYTMRTGANPFGTWLSDQCWSGLCTLVDLDPQRFGKVMMSLEERVEEWKDLCECSDPQDREWPIASTSSGSDADEDPHASVDRLMVMRVLRPDRMVQAVQQFVAVRMGRQYIEPPPFDLASAFTDSSSVIPLIFVLSTGADPMSHLMKFAEQQRIPEDNLHALSLGQGQGPIAERKLKEAMQRGGWVVLQNCHLAVSWMPTLEAICEAMRPERIHSDFRLWLTSMPSPAFPLSVLQNGVKMTNEPPQGLRAKLNAAFTSDPISSAEFFDSVPTNDAAWKKLLFGLCFFHGLVQERKGFGAIGWNVPYDFNDSDLRISIRQLQMMLTEFEEIPYDALKYLTGQANYGGRVTDDWDRRCLMAILSDFLTPSMLDDKYRFSPSGVYYSIPAGSHGDYVDYIKQLPLEESPLEFGLHMNAAIVRSQQDTSDLLTAAADIQNGLVASLLRASNSADDEDSSADGTGSGALSREEMIDATAEKLLRECPLPFDITAAQAAYPVSYHQSMNTVLVQELIRYNRLVEVIRESLALVRKAIKGEIVMSSELEKLANGLYTNVIPDMWSQKSYPSLKPLASYVQDLVERLQFFQRWIDDGPPATFWLSGFYFTQSFLTGVLQNYARKYAVPIDLLGFDFAFKETADDHPTEPAEDGCYVYGLFIEGARFDGSAGQLIESAPRELYSEFPVIQLKPVQFSTDEDGGSHSRSPAEAQDLDPKHYHCPVYKTSERRGTLSTTGHSTNYVMTIRVPTGDYTPHHWVKRGVALLCQLDT